MLVLAGCDERLKLASTLQTPVMRLSEKRLSYRNQLRRNNHLMTCHSSFAGQLDCICMAAKGVYRDITGVLIARLFSLESRASR